MSSTWEPEAMKSLVVGKVFQNKSFPIFVSEKEGSHFFRLWQNPTFWKANISLKSQDCYHLKLLERKKSLALPIARVNSLIKSLNYAHAFNTLSRLRHRGFISLKGSECGRQIEGPFQFDTRVELDNKLMTWW